VRTLTSSGRAPLRDGAVTDPEDDEELDELDEDLFDVWTRPDPLGTSTAHTRLDEWVDDDEAAPAALQRESDTLASEVQEAAARHAADPNADYHGLLAETENAADTVDGLAVVAGQLYVQFMTVRRGWMDYAETAAGDVVQSVQTTLGAIGLLLRNGYALDAEARWRGLHELACTAALLATDTDPPGICMRYLAHGQRLLVDDPAYQQPWVRDRVRGHEKVPACGQ